MRVLTTYGAVHVYQTRDLSASVIPSLPSGSQIQIGEITAFEGSEWHPGGSRFTVACLTKLLRRSWPNSTLLGTNNVSMRTGRAALVAGCRMVVSPGNERQRMVYHRNGCHCWGCRDKFPLGQRF